MTSPQAQDKLTLKIGTDSPIDLGQLEWKPVGYYTQAQGVPVQDDNGNYLIRFDLNYDVDLYSANMGTAPQLPWVAPADGAVTITPAVDIFGGSGATGQVAFTVKQHDRLVNKAVLEVQQGQAVEPLLQPVTLNLKAGDALYFDFSVRQAVLGEAILSSGVSVSYGMVQNEPAASA